MLNERFLSQETTDIMVDALDGGEIVRVTESYARREGLPILRKWTPPQLVQKPANKLGPKETGGMDTFRRPLKKDDQGIRGALLDNFHWVLSQKRRSMNMSRKQLAAAVEATEHDIKLLENGVLPSNDFILIGALERYCGFSLRKEGPASAPPASALRSAKNIAGGLGSAPLFGTARKESSENSVSEEDLLERDDLLGDAVELEDERSKAL